MDNGEKLLCDLYRQYRVIRERQRDEQQATGGKFTRRYYELMIAKRAVRDQIETLCSVLRVEPELPQERQKQKITWGIISDTTWQDIGDSLITMQQLEIIERMDMEEVQDLVINGVDEEQAGSPAVNYILDFMNGMSISEIARKYGVEKSTVSRLVRKTQSAAAIRSGIIFADTVDEAGYRALQYMDLYGDGLTKTLKRRILNCSTQLWCAAHHQPIPPEDEIASGNFDAVGGYRPKRR